MTHWQQILSRTNRATALSLLTLDEPLRRSVTLGLLTLQTLHEVEAMRPWPAVVRRRTIQTFAELVEDPTQANALATLATFGAQVSGTSDALPTLVNRLPELVASIEGLSEVDQRAIWCHADRAVDRSLAYAMRARPDGHVVVRDTEELAGYCHLHGGIAAELITDLIVAGEPSLAPVADDLRQIASSSAQGIGLVDYLDAEGAEQPCPICVLAPLERGTILTMSQDGMRRAERYISVLREAGARRQVVAFASLSLAWAKTRLDRVRWYEGASQQPPPTLPPTPRINRTAFGLS
jgi:hypothetical protein